MEVYSDPKNRKEDSCYIWNLAIDLLGYRLRSCTTEVYLLPCILEKALKTLIKF